MLHYIYVPALIVNWEHLQDSISYSFPNSPEGEELEILSSYEKSMYWIKAEPIDS